MDVLGTGRKGVSEILAAVLMLAITIVGFALIAPLLVQGTQSQASSIITDLKNGQIADGQSLSLVYQYSNFSTKATTPYANFGLLNYGSSPILVKYIFIFTKSQTFDVTAVSTLTDSSARERITTACSESPPYCQLEPQAVLMLQIEPSGVTGAPAAMNSSSYELVLYSTSNLAFTFTGSAAS